MRKFLNTITKDLFPSVPDIQVTEFGFAEPFESQLDSLQTILWDLRRSDYYQGYLDNILAAVVEDGVNVTGAWGWAIFDSEFDLKILLLCCDFCECADANVFIVQISNGLLECPHALDCSMSTTPI